MLAESTIVPMAVVNAQLASDMEERAQKQRFVVSSQAIVWGDGPAVRGADDMVDIAPDEVAYARLHFDEYAVKAVFCRYVLLGRGDARRKGGELANFNGAGFAALSSDAVLGGEETDVNADGL